MTECEPGSPQPRQPSQKIVDVNIYTTNFDSDPFKLRWRFKGKLDWNEGEIITEKGHDHDLHFEIVDEAKLGVTFKCEPDEAFGATTGKACPQPGDNGEDEIDFKRSNVAEKGRKLFIRDRNHTAAKLRFALFFDSPGGDRKYDPIIQNTGGGPPV